ncbi:uncharacterized protein N7473_003673 [Penicillium subrubescens]|uniref:uncharacterized protein n=1 Tax=Penicillium subrubescens TaxID=1316194 RepID=UPI00254525EF|nr:uncharacterized protein N7473_003673 [Penicillium subrubescens]KAJ5906757.1 hypothetical protein N7473_003673 [Penicillium subrubescens]
MDLLPPELISLVLNHLKIARDHEGRSFSLAPYATLGRHWQAIIERRTFAKIRIHTAKRLEEFQRIVTNPSRRSCVKRINLVVRLESYDVQARAQWETDEDRQQNNKIFTSTICTLFKILSSWPNDAASIELSIQAMCPSDFLDMKQRRKPAARSRLDDLLQKRYERSYLQFSRTTTDVQCPPVPIVNYLSIRGLRNKRLIEPASSVFIASKLPRLNRVELLMKDEYNAFEMRFDLKFQYEPPRDQHYAPPDVTVDGSDLLSSALRDLSQRLESLHIDDFTVLGPELFWPLNSKEYSVSVNLPFWPNLKEVVVNYAPVTPSGEWLQERDPEDTDTDDNTDPEYYNAREEGYPESVRVPLEDRRCIHFRFNLIASHANRFYISAAWAALRMPKLRQMILQTDGISRYSLEYEVRAGTSRLTWRTLDSADCLIGGDPSTKQARAERLYQPDARVLEAWENVAPEHTGRGLETEFKEWWD